ncbi:MAG: LysE family translocator [Hyphomicrobiales bacterium]
MESEVAPLSSTWRPLMALILASVAIMGSPGPSTISATAMGAAFGIRRSLGYVCGLILGTIAVLLAVSVGVVALVLSIPHGARVLGAISVAYIFFLAFKIATAPPLDGRSGHLAAPAFGGGFLLAIANPKAYLAIAAVFAGTTILTGDRGLDAVVKTALLGAMIVIIHMCWLLAGASLSRILHDPVSSRLVNVSLAAALVIMTLVAFVA